VTVESIPLIGAAISYAGAQVDDNIIAIVGISAVLCVAMIAKPFDEASMFALTMSGISGVAALAGYEIGKRKNDEKV
jgi:hypothetical protein